MKRKYVVVITMSLVLSILGNVVNAVESNVMTTNNAEKSTPNASIDLSKYSNSGLPIYENSRVTYLDFNSSTGNMRLKGYMLEQFSNYNKKNSFLREIVFVSVDGASSYRYDISQNAVFNKFLNSNQTLNPTNLFDYSYAHYDVNFNLGNVLEYQSKVKTGLPTGKYRIYIRMSDGRRSNVMPLKNTKSDVAIPVGFEVDENNELLLNYIKSNQQTDVNNVSQNIKDSGSEIYASFEQDLYGKVVFYKDKLYEMVSIDTHYINSFDLNGNSKILKKTKQDSGNFINNIILIKNDWIYYVMQEYAYNNKEYIGRSMALYRMKLDGSQQVKVQTLVVNKNGVDKFAGYDLLHIIGSTVYYIYSEGSYSNNEVTNYIRKRNLDGTGDEIVAKIEKNKTSTDKFAVPMNQGIIYQSKNQYNSYDLKMITANGEIILKTNVQSMFRFRNTNNITSAKNTKKAEYKFDGEEYLSIDNKVYRLTEYNQLELIQNPYQQYILVNMDYAIKREQVGTGELFGVKTNYYLMNLKTSEKKQLNVRNVNALTDKFYYARNYNNEYVKVSIIGGNESKMLDDDFFSFFELNNNVYSCFDNYLRYCKLVE